MRIVLTCALAFALALPAGAGAASPELKTDEQKTLYTLGLLISRSLGAFSLTEAELALVQAGVGDGVMKREQKLDLQVYGPRVKELQEARLAASSVSEKKVGQAYLDKAATEKGAVGAVARPVQGGAVPDRLLHVDAAGPRGDQAGRSGARLRDGPDGALAHAWRVDSLHVDDVVTVDDGERDGRAGSA